MAPLRPSVLHGPPAATLVRLLNDLEEHDFPSPRRILDGLTGIEACTIPPGLPYSVAQIVAHMLSNMRFNLGLIRAPDPLHFDERFEDWPRVAPEDWPRLRDEFLEALRALVELARDEGGLSRVIYPQARTEPAWTVGYKLALSVAKHNAYHLGQIVVVRRVSGVWG